MAEMYYWWKETNQVPEGKKELFKKIERKQRKRIEIYFLIRIKLINRLTIYK